MGCVTNVDFIAANASIVTSVARGGGRKLMESLGVPMGRTRAERDARVVDFLRALDLDPVAILGPHTTAEADFAAKLRAARPPVDRRRFALNLVRVATI